MELWLPKEKLQRVRAVVQQWLGQKATKRWDLESLVGPLQHAMKADVLVIGKEVTYSCLSSNILILKSQLLVIIGVASRLLHVQNSLKLFSARAELITYIFTTHYTMQHKGKTWSTPHISVMILAHTTTDLWWNNSNRRNWAYIPKPGFERAPVYIS